LQRAAVSSKGARSGRGSNCGGCFCRFGECRGVTDQCQLYKNITMSKMSPARKDSVRVFAPATVANMICGFDVLGVAIDEPGDEVYMRRVDQPGVRLVNITGDDGRLPREAEKNTVSASVLTFLQHIGQPDIGLEIELHKQMPIGSGLGSSAASTVAGLFAVNTLLGSPLSRKELLPFAVQGEALACGHGHADNVAPALLGGVTLIRGYDPLDVVALPAPPQLH